MEWWDDSPLLHIPTVEDLDGPRVSSLLGPDGLPLPYAKKGLGFIGFYRLKEERLAEPGTSEGGPCAYPQSQDDL